MTKKKLIFIVILLIIIFGGLVWWLESSRPEGNGDEEVKPELIDFTYDGASRQFLVIGKNLTSVDVVGVPTSADTNEDEYEKMGEMVIDNESDIQNWILPVPKYPMAITEILAIARNENEEAVGRMSLAIKGATEIYNTLWLQVPFEEAVLSVGESFTTENLTIKLVDIAEDSRCPIGVECIQAGRITTDIEITMDGKISMISLRSDEGERKIGENFFINIVKIEPPAKEGKTLAATDYIISFYVTKEIEKI
ncbi:MAG: hypothetical protein AAB821_00045 [Patescibacteria group bacterium]